MKNQVKFKKSYIEAAMILPTAEEFREFILAIAAYLSEEEVGDIQSETGRKLWNVILPEMDRALRKDRLKRNKRVDVFDLLGGSRENDQPPRQ